MIYYLYSIYIYDIYYLYIYILYKHYIYVHIYYVMHTHGCPSRQKGWTLYNNFTSRHSLFFRRFLELAEPEVRMSGHVGYVRGLVDDRHEFPGILETITY